MSLVTSSHSLFFLLNEDYSFPVFRLYYINISPLNVPSSISSSFPLGSLSPSWFYCLSPKRFPPFVLSLYFCVLPCAGLYSPHVPSLLILFILCLSRPPPTVLMGV